jgi:hypothetical protein
VAAGGEPPSVSSSPEQTGQGAAADRPGGHDVAAAGLGAPPMGRITDSGRRWRGWLPAEEPHGFAALRSAIAVEHDCGAVVENILENEDKRIRLDAS